MIQACDIFYWNKSAQTWKTADGNWYSLDEVNVKALQQTIETLIEISKLGMDRQWIIADKGLDFLKNILSCPSPNPDHNEITLLTWQLMFNLILENNENRSKIWHECNELFFNYLQQSLYDNDTCRLIVYNIYALGGVGQQQGTSILKILLNSFHREKRAVPLKDQGLTCFLEHFITDEKNITTMYPTLTTTEKMSLIQFTIDYVTKTSIDDFRDSPVSLDLLFSICNDFNSKCETIFHSQIVDDSQLKESLALFEIIAHVSNDTSYEMNKFNFALLLNVGQLINYAIFNEDMMEATFSNIKRNSKQQLNVMLLTTASNLVRDNNEHKERVSN